MRTLVRLPHLIPLGGKKLSPLGFAARHAMDLEQHLSKRLKPEGPHTLAATSSPNTDAQVIGETDPTPAELAHDTIVPSQPATAAAPAPTKNGAPTAKKKQITMPPILSPPQIPDDISVWDSTMLLVDKPQTWTSFDVCGKLKGSLANLLGKKNRNMKVGHAGTLDPMATGLLIVCIGRGTKSISAFVDMGKEYSGTLRLGEGTASLDADSEVTERLPWEHITDADLLAARDKFLGSIEQTPPMFSAIRVGGKRLYESAREGKEVERASRTIRIDRFDVRRDENDKQNVHFYVACSKGTYIRTLAQDLALSLGSTAHLIALRREAIGEYKVDGAWDINELAGQIKGLREKRQTRVADEQPAVVVDDAKQEEEKKPDA